MTLIGQNPASHLLDRMVTCQHCGAPMETAGESLNEAPKYVCTTKNKGCGTPDIDAELFNRLILRTVINAILDENNISKVTEIVHEEALKESEEAVDVMLQMPSAPHAAPPLQPQGTGATVRGRKALPPHGQRERIREDGSRTPRDLETGRTVPERRGKSKEGETVLT